MHGLNPAQQEAVLHRGSHLLVLAGAGSGKTRVVTLRIAELLRRNIAPENIVGVTFTNKAAKEMRERLVENVGANKCRGLSLSTFHSFCIRLLREHGHHVGLKSFFAIADTADQIQQLMKVAYSYGPLLKKYPPRQILGQISFLKNQGYLPDATPPPKSEIEGLAQAVYGAYQAQLKALQLVDFDDLLLMAREVLKEQKAVRDIYQEKIHFLLIDEYQDTNPLQLSLIQLLTGQHCEVCAVGDDDQAIYAFRGANIENILKFERDFAPCKTIKLQQNYRSTQTILKAAQGVIEKNPFRNDKKIFSRLGHGKKIELLECDDGANEAERVTLAIKEDIETKGIAPHEIALLYRANPQSRLFEGSLKHHSVPYKIIGGTSFFDTKEVKNLIAWLALIDRPNNELAFRRMVNFPARGIGNKSLEKIIDGAQEQKSSFLNFSAQGAPSQELKATTQQSLSAFATPLWHAHQTVKKAHPRQVVDLCEQAFAQAGYKRWIAEEKDPKTRDRITEAHQGFLDALALHCEEYEDAKANPNAPHNNLDTQQPLLRSFLQKLAIEEKDDPNDKQKKTKKGRITLMSFHAAKGLEFEKVYMVGFEEGLLPHKRAIEEGDKGIQEERRLCYVGITRAKKQLVLSYAKWRRRRHQRIQRETSQFLPDIPKEALAPALSDLQTEDETAFAAFSALKEKFAKASQNDPKEVEGA